MLRSTGRSHSITVRLTAFLLLFMLKNPLNANETAAAGQIGASTERTSFCATLKDTETAAGTGDHHRNGKKSRANRPQRFVLEAYVNGSRQNVSVQAVCLPDNNLGLTAADWQALHLRPVPETDLPNGETAYALEAIPGAGYQVNTLEQSIAITIPTEAFEEMHLEGRKALDPVPPPPPPGGYLTYDLSTTMANKQGFNSYGASLEAVSFGSYGQLVTNGVVSSIADVSHVIRNQSYWQRQFPNEMVTLTVGDSSGVGGAWSRPVNFGGIRYARDFGTRPGFITYPMPSISGSAALPSVVEVLINNQQRLTTNVDAGPFDISNVPIVSGGGQMQLVVRDQLGRETVITQDYYISPQLLAVGLSNFSYEAGFRRNGYGLNSFGYGNPIADATYRWGVYDWLTTEVRGEAEKDRGAVGIGTVTSLDNLGAINLAAGYADSKNGQGGHYLAGFSSFAGHSSFNIQYENFDPGYRPFAANPNEITPKQRTFAGGSLQMGPAGSLGAAFTYQTNRDGSTNEFVSTGWSKQMGFVGVSLSFTDNLVNHDWTSQFTVSVPLWERTSASSGVMATDGRYSSYLDVNSPVPNGNGPGLGWHVRANTQENNRFLGNVIYNTEKIGFTGGFSESQNNYGARLGATGTLGVIAGYTFAARPITSSFALVRTADLGNIPIKRWNQLAAYTADDGTALITNITAYQPSKLSIDPSDLPLDVDIEGTEIFARAWPRSGVLLDFPVRRTRNALVVLHLENGAPVPHGARVTVKPGNGRARVAKNGEAWLTNVNDENQLHVQWKDGACTASFAVPKGLAYGDKIGPITCLPPPKPQ